MLQIEELDDRNVGQGFESECGFYSNSSDPSSRVLILGSKISLSLSLYYFLLKLISIGKTVHKSLPEGTGYAAL